MTGRIVSTLAIIAALGASPALARDMISPGAVLAGKNVHNFKERTARITSIMGSEMNAPPMKIPTKPGWHHSVRRDADAAASLR